MKAFWFLFVTFFLSYAASDEAELSKNVKLKNPGIRAVLDRSLDLFNNGKKKYKAPYRKPVKKVVVKDGKEYTAWPSETKGVVKDSLLFSADHEDHKPRVKKVVPESKHPIVRRKRGLDVKDSKRKATKKDNGTRAQTLASLGKQRNHTSKSSGHARLAKSGHTNRTQKGSRPAKRAGHGKKGKRSKKGSKRSKKQLRSKRNKRSGNSKSKQPNKRHSGPLGKNGKVLKETRRLTGAQEAMIRDFPFVVTILKDGEHWCTGALLNQRMVITTANCIWKANRVSRLRIRAGSRHVNNGGQVARINEVMKHPGWSLRKHPDNDVALLLLDRHIKFSHSVHSIDLPNRAMYPAFEDLWVVSWGSDRRDGETGTTGPTLQWYSARVMEREKCNNITMRYGVSVTPNFICLSQKGKRSPCTRDTGAPAVSDGILWGMASWGIRKRCGTERFPAMFSYLGSNSNVDFIANASRTLMAEKMLNPFLDKLPRYANADVSS